VNSGPCETGIYEPFFNEDYNADYFSFPKYFTSDLTYDYDNFNSFKPTSEFPVENNEPEYFGKNPESPFEFADLLPTVSPPDTPKRRRRSADMCELQCKLDTSNLFDKEENVAPASGKPSEGLGPRFNPNPEMMPDYAPKDYQDNSGEIPTDFPFQQEEYPFKEFEGETTTPTAKTATTNFPATPK